MKKILAAFVVFAAGISGCTSMSNGPYQAITVASEPAGAACRLHREEEGVIERVPNTPEKIYIRRSFKPMTITCNQEGYLETSLVLPPSPDEEMAVNLVTAGIGMLVDVATGAVNEYPESVTVKMAR